LKRWEKVSFVVGMVR